MKAEIKHHLFQEAISRVYSFASTDKNRPQLNAIFIKNLSNGQVEVATADGFRAAYVTIPCEMCDGEIGAIGSIDISEIDKPSKEMGRLFSMKRQNIMLNMQVEKKSPDAIYTNGANLWSLKSKYPESKTTPILLPNLHMDLEPFFNSAVAMKMDKIWITVQTGQVFLTCKDEEKSRYCSFSFEHSSSKSLYTEWLVNLKLFRSITRAANGMQMELFVPDGTWDNKPHEHHPLFFREFQRETVSFILMPMHDSQRAKKSAIEKVSSSYD